MQPLSDAKKAGNSGEKLFVSSKDRGVITTTDGEANGNLESADGERGGSFAHSVRSSPISVSGDRQEEDESALPEYPFDLEGFGEL